MGLHICENTFLSRKGLKTNSDDKSIETGGQSHTEAGCSPFYFPLDLSTLQIHLNQYFGRALKKGFHLLACATLSTFMIIFV